MDEPKHNTHLMQTVMCEINTTMVHWLPRKVRDHHVTHPTDDKGSPSVNENIRARNLVFHRVPSTRGGFEITTTDCFYSLVSPLRCPL